MINSKQRIADRLRQARMIVEGAQRPEAAQALADFGYPQGTLAEGVSYQQAAEQAYLRALKEHGDVVYARVALETALRQLHARYMSHVRLVRQAFPRNSVARQRLNLIGRRRMDRSGWLRQVADFYHEALDDGPIQDCFDRHGINLLAAQDEVAQALMLEGELQRKRGQALLARQERDAAFARLEGWIKPFVAAARIVFGSSRGLLEQLGL